MAAKGKELGAHLAVRRGRPTTDRHAVGFKAIELASRDASAPFAEARAGDRGDAIVVAFASVSSD